MTRNAKIRRSWFSDMPFTRGALVRRSVRATALMVLTLSISGEALAAVRGILNQQAPSWGVERWVRNPGGDAALDVDDFRGRVVYLYCFQSWCPGCHSRGFPTLRKIIDRYADDPEVGIVAVQTVFEGFDANTPEKAEETAAKYALDIPVGHSGSSREPSALMRAYRTGGTPWTVIIDKNGTVRYNGFHIRPEQAINLIGDLKKEAVAH